MASVVNITRTAAKQLVRIAADHEAPRILFSVTSGGCVGFKYNLKPMTNTPQKLDEVVSCGPVELVVCGKSLMHVLGTTIDWKKDIMGETFYFENPSANSMCGCGTSFC